VKFVREGLAVEGAGTAVTRAGRIALDSNERHRLEVQQTHMKVDEIDGEANGVIIKWCNTLSRDRAVSESVELTVCAMKPLMTRWKMQPS